MPSTPRFHAIPHCSIQVWNERNWKPGVAGLEAGQQRDGERQLGDRDGDGDRAEQLGPGLGQQRDHERAEGGQHDDGGQEREARS